MAEYRCGPVELKEITYRRGSAVWKATGPVATVAIKSGYGEGAEITVREAAVLDALAGCSATAGSNWYVTDWVDGPSTWEVFRSARESADDGGRVQALGGAIELCRAVAALHAEGWVHSDLQPSHGIHATAGVRLIDFAWAWHPGFEQHPAFRGGITHLVAPELAASIAAGVRPVRPSVQAEVYALAGVLWTCVTGAWPLDYVAAGIDWNATTPDELRAAIATAEIPLAAARPWAEVQSVLADVLSAGPQKRPTAVELANVLTEVVP
ncbi:MULTISPECIES: hypothetical protein [unclassified Kitasatospora]|uniref:hypothetical protein n=1 Tax=unclassified Kitasatospora TaxID=2633591 RepID=UPI002473BCDC|nr:hypothetical protein [Kitasatospora sp. MAP12-44]